MQAIEPVDGAGYAVTVNKEIIIPDECVPYIRMQRSRYSEEKAPFMKEVKRRYAEHVAEDFAGMEPHLPAHVDSILEIGCGMAALQVFMKRKYPDARLELLDGDTVSRRGGAGYSQNPDIYNSRRHTEMLLDANGVTVDGWRDINTRELLKADLIISMASFSYHYPRSTYRINGFSILDFRRGTEKIPVGGKIVYVGPKYDRVAFMANDK